MILLDEQVREDQRALLVHWRIPFRQIGREIAHAGTQDADILPLLHSLKKPTFFTHDQGFFKRTMVHPRYCLVWLDVADVTAAAYIRRFLRFRRFATQASRMGIVARVHSGAIQLWTLRQERIQKVNWVEI